jgi:hypothetical protein
MALEYLPNQLNLSRKNDPASTHWNWLLMLHIGDGTKLKNDCVGKLSVPEGQDDSSLAVYCQGMRAK